MQSRAFYRATSAFGSSKPSNELEVIGIEGGMDSPAKIPSLRPLAGLRSLRAFLATSTRLGDKDLMPLAECPNLRFLGIARVAPQSEFQRLMQARPDLHCSWSMPAPGDPVASALARRVVAGAVLQTAAFV